jgi:hypothetical protein
MVRRIMKRREFLAAAVLAPTLASVRNVTQESDESGFVSLFDGTSLNGWSVVDGADSAFYVQDGAILAHESGGFPTWLRSARQYENFDFRGEFFLQGWMNSGIYLHAPEHGRNISCGMKINIFQQLDAIPKPESMGSIFPLVPPLKVNVKNKGEWNSFRILMDWPRLRVWTNGEMVQDLDVETVPELRHRLRSGYLGLESLSYPIRFRGLRVRELPSKVAWTGLYETAADFSKWRIISGKPLFRPIGNVLHGDGDGFLGTLETYRDFEFQMYVRHVRHHNGGVSFGGPGGGVPGRRYEVQLHDVEGAHYATGSLYSVKRASYPRIEPEQWWLFQLRVKDNTVLVRCNGDAVLEYDQLEFPTPGPIALQAHSDGRWTQYKQINVRRI